MSHSPRQKVKYEKVSHSEESAVEECLRDTNTKPKKTNSCNNFCKWVIDDPLKKLPFFYFFVSLLILPILAIVYPMDKDSIYTISGLFALLICIYSLNHFRLLLYLKKEIIDVSQSNIKFKNNHTIISREINRVISAKNELLDTRNKLQNVIEKKRENLKAFREIQRNMRSTNLNNIDGIYTIRTRANKLIDNCTISLHKKERKVLFSVFDKYAKQGNKRRMTRALFDEFLEMIPRTFADRFKRLGTFRKLSGNKTYIDYKDFEVCLKLFDEMNVKDIDMDFKIELRAPSSDVYVSQLKRQISITKRSAPGQQLRLEDIELDNGIVMTNND